MAVLCCRAGRRAEGRGVGRGTEVCGDVAMQVFVRLGEGRTIVVPGCGAETMVESFERAVQDRCAGVADARLVYGTKQLAAGRTLGDYNLREGSTVEQLGRLRGGGVRADINSSLQTCRDPSHVCLSRRRPESLGGAPLTRGRFWRCD